VGGCLAEAEGQWESDECREPSDEREDDLTPFEHAGSFAIREFSAGSYECA
jgi:hypothetical protein